MVRKKTCVILRLLLCSIFLIWTLSVPVAAQELPVWPDLPDGPDIQVQAIPDTRGSQVGADAAIVMEASTGLILFEQDIDEHLPIASTTKIMTALLTLEQPELDEEFIVNADAIKVEGSSMGLQEGDTVTLRSLAVGMLLPSGNDAAGAAAVRISGSIPKFVTAMNQRAAFLGMTNTSFETPSGLDGEKHYSSARDMATLTRAALQNADFRSICSQYKMRTAFGNPPYERWLTNHNKLLNYCEGAIGVKTGFTKKAGRCLVSAVERDGVTLICVTLNCPNDWKVHQGLYDRYFGTIEMTNVSDGIPPVTVPVTGGTRESVTAIAYDKLEIPVPAGSAELEYRVNIPPFLYAPVLYGQTLGQVEVLRDGELLHTLTLMAGEDIPLLHAYEEKKGLGKWFGDLFHPDSD